MLDQAAKLVGPERFKGIFGFAPDQKIDRRSEHRNDVEAEKSRPLGGRAWA
jgi:hypothetical protein